MTGGTLAGDYSQESSSERLSEPSATRKASEEAGERKLSCTQETPGPSTPGPGNPGKATLAEAKLRIVVMDVPLELVPSLCSPEDGGLICSGRAQLGPSAQPASSRVLPGPIPDPVVFSSSLG